MFGLYLLADALSDPISDPLGGKFASLSNVFGFALNLIIFVGSALVIYNLALGFTGIAMAADNPENAKKNQKKVMYSIIGGVLVFFIAVLRQILPELLGVESFTINTVTDF